MYKKEQISFFDVLKVVIYTIILVNVTKYIIQLVYTTPMGFSEDFLISRRRIVEILAFISIYVYIMIRIGNRILRLQDYQRDVDGLVEPLIAEYMIDKDHGIKELIMTGIIQLHLKKKIEIINNKTIKLVSRFDVEDYELALINFLFRKSDVIDFVDINKLFSIKGGTQCYFIENIGDIKRKISRKIKDLKLVDEKKTFYMRILHFISVLIVANMPLVLTKGFGNWSVFDFLASYHWISIYVSYNMFIIYLVANKFRRNLRFKEFFVVDQAAKRRRRRRDLEIQKNGIFTKFIVTVFLIYTIVLATKVNLLFTVWVIVVMFINFLIAKATDDLVFSIKGKIEQSKLAALKRYIIDYSLIKDRDVKEVIIWDEYLAYATAFGIPNKVVKKITENWYNLNVNMKTISLMMD